MRASALCVFALVLAGGESSPGPYDGDNRRLLAVELKLAMPSVIDPKDLDLPALEKHLAEHVAEQGHQFARFVRWEAWNATTAPKPHAKLTVVLAEETKDKWSEVQVHFQVERDGKEFKVLALKPHLLYRVGDPLPTGSIHQISEQLKEKLTTVFDNESRRKTIREGFLRAVPICDDLIAVETQQRILLPLRTALMACQPRAVLRIDLSADLGQGAAEGELFLQHDGTFRGGNPDWNGLARFRVSEFSFPPPGPVQGWDQRILEVLKKKSSLKIHMWDYQIDLNSDTEGSLSSDVGGR